MKKVPYRAYRQIKNSWIVANIVIKVIATLLMSGEGKDKSSNRITGNWVTQWPSFPLFYWMASVLLISHGMPWIRVRRRKNFCVGFLYAVHRPGEWLWIDSNGKVETRYPAEGYFDNEFPSICNHCGVMAARSRHTLGKKISIFCVFWGKTTHYWKHFQSSVPKGFIA